ncbi:MAG: hypothetical protein IIY28_02985 [Lachnospiraceae bacterium]|nr:hypothetical protein [Lachnospiraceae bacterium]
MANIVVNIANLKQSCENNTRYTKNLSTQLEKMDAVERQLGAKWKGLAGFTYLERTDAKQMTLQEIINGMQTVVNYESKAVQIYTRANQYVDEMIDEMF